MSLPPPPLETPRRRAARRLLDVVVVATLLVHGARRLRERIDPPRPLWLRPPLCVDVATAPYEDLVLLPSIGPGRARAILADRERHGPVRDLDELVRVPGIGPGIVAGLRAATDVRVVAGAGGPAP